MTRDIVVKMLIVIPRQGNRRLVMIEVMDVRSERKRVV